jgi:hypothetical protein
VEPELHAELLARHDESLQAIVKRSARFLVPGGGGLPHVHLLDDAAAGGAEAEEDSESDESEQSQVVTLATAASSGGGRPNDEFHAELETALMSKSKEPRDFSYFKYVRVGQIQLELILQGFAYINSVQRAAVSRPVVLHRKLLTWSKVRWHGSSN